MKKTVLIAAAVILMSVQADAQAGFFDNNCCCKTNPVRDVVDGTKNVVRGTFCLAGKIIAAPFQLLRHVHKSSCRPCRVTTRATVRPRVRLPRTPNLDQAPSPFLKTAPSP